MDRLAVVIPALNAAGTLPGTLEALFADGAIPIETVVVDGGSRDATAELARAAGCRVIAAPRGRGGQLAAGARATDAPWLLFLHADTRLQTGWRRAAKAFAAQPVNARRAGVFRLRFDDPSPAARRVEWLAERRARWLGLPYGDQGLLISRDFYDRLGGFGPMPIMEDVDMVRRIGRRRLVMLPRDALTSPARYRRTGYARRAMRNLVCLGSYLLGAPPRLVAKLYG